MQHIIETQDQPRKLYKPIREEDTLRREVLVAYSCDDGTAPTTTGDPGSSGGAPGGDPGSGGDPNSFP